MINKAKFNHTVNQMDSNQILNFYIENKWIEYFESYSFVIWSKVKTILQ